MRTPFAAAVVAAAAIHTVNGQDFLNNQEPLSLNTGNGFEAVTTLEERLAMIVPTAEDHISPVYDALEDAICFTDNYNVPTFINHEDLYKDFKTIFHDGLVNPTDVSVENNGVSNDRFASMYLRMCFHDNPTNTANGDFPTYVQSNMRQSWIGTWNWIGPSPWMETSGSDASVLTCVAERHHPNQNYDQTATRVLKTMQNSIPGQSVSLKNKYGLSYADLLHNGCIAATIFSAGLDVTTVLDKNPFIFGRKDACVKETVNWFGDYVTKPLCGPTELLPGVLMSVQQVDDWFVDRGFNQEQWLALFWTHTLMDNMAHNCPLRHLPCTHDVQDTTWQTPVPDTDPPHRPINYYITNGAVLDYFKHFLNQGEHSLHATEGLTMEQLEEANCDWSVDNTEYPWPMTRVDCAIAKDNAVIHGRSAVKDAIEYFSGLSKEEIADYLLCTLRMLSTGDPSSPAGGACAEFEHEDPSHPHSFGAFF